VSLSPLGYCDDVRDEAGQDHDCQQEVRLVSTFTPGRLVHGNACGAATHTRNRIPDPPPRFFVLLGHAPEAIGT
jgi:hypothetical protein